MLLMMVVLLLLLLPIHWVARGFTRSLLTTEKTHRAVGAMTVVVCRATAAAAVVAAGGHERGWDRVWSRWWRWWPLLRCLRRSHVAIWWKDVRCGLKRMKGVSRSPKKD